MSHDKNSEIKQGLIVGFIGVVLLSVGTWSGIWIQTQDPRDPFLAVIFVLSLGSGTLGLFLSLALFEVILIVFPLVDRFLDRLFKSN